jgi:cytoskeleton-associated protein 5
MLIPSITMQPASRKGGGTGKSVTSKKTDGGAAPKVAAPVETEDVEVGAKLQTNASTFSITKICGMLIWFDVYALQPSDMSLEEIEERLSNVVKAETINQLKSSVWKERLEGNHYFIS